MCDILYDILYDVAALSSVRLRIDLEVINCSQCVVVLQIVYKVTREICPGEELLLFMKAEEYSCDNMAPDIHGETDTHTHTHTHTQTHTQTQTQTQTHTHTHTVCVRISKLCSL